MLLNSQHSFQTMDSIPQEVQDIVDRANAAIRNNTVQEHIQELRAHRTEEENAQIDRAVQQVMNRAQRVEPFTGTPHKIDET